MKKLLLFLCGVFAFLSIFPQERTSLRVLKIRKIENDCYKLTAKCNGKRIVIYSHYEKGLNDGERIRCHEDLNIMIIPFFETKHFSLAQYKNEMGMRAEAEDSARFVDVTIPLNYESINIDYYGNHIKIGKKMQYYTTEINGVFKRHRNVTIGDGREISP